MKKIAKILLILFACFIVVAGLRLFALDRLFSGMCGNEIFQETVAPDGRFKAVLFQRDCGATTGFSTQISLLPVDDDLPNEGGNIFVANGHPKENKIELAWQNSTELVIKHAEHLKSFKKETARKGIKVNYE